MFARCGALRLFGDARISWARAGILHVAFRVRFEAGGGRSIENEISGLKFSLTFELKRGTPLR